ncbi:DUF4040 domain-containing protein [Vallitalea pronyensis]|uniref:DUF4040 domain-containing protein n=1 Tax=Vallitalea pronyensis TaxID=1348613 RepID=A0A8J8MJF0_9FIRM|nr:DUF4040 domain-containing protein [Vallitalea pronyensis]QUI22684.1 DUF4040 domain-containing protein [Vallitalea pronyensis]
MIEITLVLVIILAILAIQTNTLRRAIVYLCVFSLLCSFCYLLYQAPDVAIAEAVIGCTLATIIYLVALNKYKVFRVYYLTHEKTAESKQMRTTLNKTLSSFSIEKELELDMVLSDKTIEDITADYPYDVIIQYDKGQVTIYGDQSNYHFDDLVAYMHDKSAVIIQHAYLYEDEGDTLL